MATQATYAWVSPLSRLVARQMQPSPITAYPYKMRPAPARTFSTRAGLQYYPWRGRPFITSILAPFRGQTLRSSHPVNTLRRHFSVHKASRALPRGSAGGQDRQFIDFMQRNRSSGHLVKWIVIGLNTAVYATWTYAQSTQNRALVQTLFENTLCSWANIEAGRWWTLVTSGFTHLSLSHFLFNMFALDVFFSVATMTGLFGPVRLGLIVVGGAAASSFAWLYHLRWRTKSQDKAARQVNPRFAVLSGASGVVMTMAALSTSLVPAYPISLFLVPIPLPLALVTAIYVGIDLFYLDSHSTTAHSGHLGGFAFGAVYYLLRLRRFPGSVLNRFRT